MSRVKVRCQIEVYEIDGKDLDTKDWDTKHLVVESHWNDRDRIILRFVDDNKPPNQIVDSSSITVIADDLEAAIHNAKNSGGL